MLGGVIINGSYKSGELGTLGKLQTERLFRGAGRASSKSRALEALCLSVAAIALVLLAHATRGQSRLRSGTVWYNTIPYNTIQYFWCVKDDAARYTRAESKREREREKKKRSCKTADSRICPRGVGGEGFTSGA